MKKPKSFHRSTRTFRSVALYAVLMATATSALAADAKEDPWRFIATVPLWAPAITGDATVKGRRSDIDVGFDELWDHLDAAFSIALEARKERFGFYGDMGYMKFSVDSSLPAAGAETRIEVSRG